MTTASLTVRRPDWPHRLLAIVCVVHVVLPLIVSGPHLWFGIDETVYLSQFNSHVPAVFFSAPRARGMTLIAAPVTLLTASVTAVRVYLAVLSGIALYVTFRPWLKLRSGYTIPIAALLFSSIWSTIYYSFEVMPNEWVAYAAVAATGALLTYRRWPTRRTPLLWLALALLAVALIRPSDSLYLGGALVIAALTLPGMSRSHRFIAIAALVSGAAVGWLEWAIEAEVSYGGFFTRVHDAQAENGGGGVHFALAAQWRALAGPLLCRNGCKASAPPGDQVWWYAVPVLTAIGLVSSKRRRDLAMVAVPAFAGLALAAEYTFTVTYAAPRFLTPAYALLAIPCAEGSTFIASAVKEQWRTVAVTGLVVLFFVHAAVQVRIIQSDILPSVTAGGKQLRSYAHQLQTHGMRQPCLILGYPGDNANISYAGGCTNQPGDEPSVLAAAARGVDVVWLSVRRAPATAYWAHWRMVRLRAINHRGHHGLRAYLSFPPR